MSGYATYSYDNELSSGGGYTYTYDNEGNLTSKTNVTSHVTTTFSYDYRNRLTVVSVGGTPTATYTYDALTGGSA